MLMALLETLVGSPIHSVQGYKKQCGQTNPIAHWRDSLKGETQSSSFGNLASKKKNEKVVKFPNFVWWVDTFLSASCA